MFDGNWIADVLADLRSFASENGMHELDVALESARLVAAEEWENTAKEARVLLPRPD